MRVSKGPVIGICGPTCVGKTTVAEIIAETMRWEHRNCGKEVVEAAGRSGVAVMELAVSEHRRIDEETGECARRAESGVVIEGRYLRYVLAGWTAITMVELTCGRTERIRRCAYRTGHVEPERVIEAGDRNDLELTSRLYTRERSAADILDTTDLEPGAVARAILGVLGVRVD